MIREAYKLNKPGLVISGPELIKVDITDKEGVSWREAKKQLRRWYLEQAASLRRVTKQQYFGE